MRGHTLAGIERTLFPGAIKSRPSNPGLLLNQLNLAFSLREQFPTHQKADFETASILGI